jgi:hypothetical protein
MSNIKVICRTGLLIIGEMPDKTLVYSVDRISWFKDKRILLDMLNQSTDTKLVA